jgi:hypothetical protein
LVPGLFSSIQVFALAMRVEVPGLVQAAVTLKVLLVAPDSTPLAAVSV